MKEDLKDYNANNQDGNGGDNYDGDNDNYEEKVYKQVGSINSIDVIAKNYDDEFDYDDKCEDLEDDNDYHSDYC